MALSLIFLVGRDSGKLTPFMPSCLVKGKEKPAISPLAAEDSLLTATSSLTTPALILSPSCHISAAYCTKLDARLAKMGLPPLVASSPTSPSTIINTLAVSPISERDFIPP